MHCIERIASYDINNHIFKMLIHISFCIFNGGYFLCTIELDFNPYLSTQLTGNMWASMELKFFSKINPFFLMIFNYETISLAFDN